MTTGTGVPLGPLHELFFFSLFRFPERWIARIHEDVDDRIHEHRRDPDARVHVQRRILCDKNCKTLCGPIGKSVNCLSNANVGLEQGTLAVG